MSTSTQSGANKDPPQRATSEQNELLSTLEDVAIMIQKAQTNLKKCPKQRLTESYVKARLNTIEDYWKTFKHTHNCLLKCTTKEQRGILSYFLKEDFYACEELYVCLQGDLTDLLLKIQSPQQQSTLDIATNTSHSNQDGNLSFAKLPRIQLPTFSGRYEDWPTYQDLFIALVHNTSISDVQKLQYLKTSVSGEAEMLLRHILITDSNYAQAWELLRNRFGNKKLIVNSVLKRLFNQKRLITQSANQIKGLLDTTTECINSLNNMKICTDFWDPIIVFLVGQKLDSESLKNWEEQAYKDDCDELPTWEELKKFLESKFRTLELIAPTSSFVPREKSQAHKSFHITSPDTEESIQSAHASFDSKNSCVFCNGSHYIFNCKEFGNKSVEQRREFVKKNYLCFNCLIPNQNVYRCKQKSSCRICRRRHHSLLHQAKETTQDLTEQPEIAPVITTAHFSKEQPGHGVLLATAQVEVKSSNGTQILRALIDQGSEASFVSARVVELLGLKKAHINGVVSGVGEGNQIHIKHLVDLSVSPRFDAKKEIKVKAYILKSISTTLPSTYITMNWPQLQTIQLADPTYFTPSKIDLLLGADIFCKIIEDGLIKMSDGVVAQKTCLGWILSGQQKENISNNQRKITTLHLTRVVAEDNDLLRKFWEIETDLYNKKKLLTKEEIECERIFKNTTKREKTGRYIVQLPLKQSFEETIAMCGDTKEQAVRRFKLLEKRFELDNKLKTEYTKVIHEYRDMGHLTKSEVQDEKLSVYIPHLAVIREDKETSKTRIVFDASAKGSHGHSLNDTMMVGPVLQSDLRSLIITWRTHKICVVGDICKMYRMVNMAKEHRNLHRIVWRDNPDDQIDSFNLTTVTFGTAAAPYLAVRTLHQLADDEAHEFKDAADIIKKSFYIDDLMTGNDTVEEAITTCDEIKTVMKRGGFEMQKWSSNTETVIQHLQEDKKKTKDKIEIKLDKTIIILGLTWDRKNDTFKTNVNLPSLKHPITKRSILSDVARLFDPFGWVSPVVITAKVLIQKLWLCSLGWDDELPLELREEWKTYREELIHLQSIEIPRWLKTTSKNRNEVQIHGFADASTQAYAAVTYLRIVSNNKVHVTMIASRTKVAPLKQISVPKLELCAAALLAELINDIALLLEIPKINIFAWTDSMVVLSWLQSHPCRWRTFVANRVSDITRVLNNDCWKHVQSSDNPADIATRGIKASDLASHEIWWTGPKWLRQNEFELDKYDIPQTNLELKALHHVTIEKERPIWERFSSLTKLKRVLAYCKRFNKNRKQKEDYLTANELQSVLDECIKYYQNLTYGKEIAEMKRTGTVKKRSSLITLSPYLDQNGLIRVGGRLQNANLEEAVKHPIVIPNNQHITKLLINDAHAKTFHGGIQAMMAYLRSKYWVIRVKSSVKKCIHNCKICVVDKAKVHNQFMGQLPAVRVNQHRAFLNSGVDYAGPLLIRSSKGRGQHTRKGYICLFVCMATKAIHLEVVTDLTSEAFLAAFRRFVARRGHCQNVWSDNGTNFVGAAKELKNLFCKQKDSMTQEVAEQLANNGTTWHFIPPRMPTCGGLWEAGVQSAKRHLNRINKETKLTYEEMTTLLVQIEACLNSRPLCVIDNTTDNPLTLFDWGTPNCCS